ncbi:MAG: tyrosine--tRNA ligase, partial [Clostridiales bacterium]|nr:tyrosine--tRNA ligase [Clostridiales bacterium]
DIDRIEKLTQFKDERINEAKKVLAFEITKLIHGEEKAKEAERQALAAFSDNVDEMPEIIVPKDMNRLTDILFFAGLAPSKGEARRLIEGGGIRVNDDKIDDVNRTISEELLKNGFILHKGKKVHVKIGT